jgi:hypothetical protein
VMHVNHVIACMLFSVLYMHLLSQSLTACP